MVDWTSARVAQLTLATLLAWLAGACGESVTEWPIDAPTPTDVARDADLDAESDVSGPIDGSVDDADAEDVPADPAPDVDPAEDASEDVPTDPPIDAPADGATDPGDDPPVACSVDGRPGECIPVDECTGDRSPTPGYCPGPTEIQCCTAVDDAVCDPEAMPQPNVGLTEEPGEGGCPAGMVRVEDFCVDRFEGALEEVLSDGRRVPWSPYFNPETRRMRAVSLRGAVPQGYITGRQAESACLEAGKRQCTDEEWLRICQGLDGWAYPYGPDQISGACNENRPVHPAIEYFGTSDDWIWSQLGNPCINQLPDSLARTGEYDECVSPDGVFDLVGNLHEWTANPTGVFRGGYYVDTWRNGLGCNYATTAHNREHWDYSTGFRCCADLPGE